MSDYTSSLGLEEINPGDQAGLWGTTTNNNLALIDQAIAGVTPVYLDSKSGFTYVLTNYNGAFDEARAAVINVSYQSTQATGANFIEIPSAQKLYVFRNSSGQSITVQTSAATYTVTIANGEATLVFCDGLNAYPGIATAGVGTLTVPYGGTGVTAFSSTPGFVYTAGGTSALTSVSAVSLNSSVAGTLPVANGGTGTTSLTSGALVVGNGTGNVGTLAGSASGQVATWNGSTWTAATPSTGGVTSISAGTGIGVSSSTGAVTISNSGVTSLTAGTGITVSSSTGGVTVSASGFATLAGTNTWTGSNTFNTALYCNNYNFNASSGWGFNSGTTQAQLTLGSSNAGIFSTSAATFPGEVISNSGGGYARIGSSGVALYSSSTGMFGTSNTLGWNINGSGAASLSQSGDYSISGQGYKPGGGSWAASSDARLKDNATPLTGALAKITALNPVSYTWKYENTEPTVGFIAQEVQSVLPAAVSETEATEDQKQFVKDGKVLAVGFQNDMTAYLVGAIKELKAELDAAKVEIAALKAKA